MNPILGAISSRLYNPYHASVASRLPSTDTSTPRITVPETKPTICSSERMSSFDRKTVMDISLATSAPLFAKQLMNDPADQAVTASFVAPFVITVTKPFSYQQQYESNDPMFVTAA